MLDDQSRRGLHGFVFAASFLIHATLAAKLRAGVAEAPARTPRSQVQVELAPPPLETPALIPEPPPASTALRQPNAPVARPVAARVPQSTTTAQPDAPDNSALPVSDEGLLPQTAPGGGVSGPASEPTQVAPAVEPPVARALPAPVIQAKEGANYLNNPRPAYPRLAQREGWEGKVVLRVRVLPNGHVGQTTLQKSAGHSALDEAALEVVKRWTFVPATQGGLPVAGWVTVPLEFQLN